MSHDERALVFDCAGESLVGILSGGRAASTRGVLIVVGGPQYRVGSHRQFALLARHLAGQGVPALRFDYRGMGDAGGEARTFEHVGADIRCAVDRFFAEVPALKDVVIWGLCDAASAALFYAHEDERVSGLVLLNPWVRTEQGIARAQLRHYYVLRLLQASFWSKLARGEFRFLEAAGALVGSIRDVVWRRRSPDAGSSAREAPLPERMADGLRRFRGRALFILSGNDLTAQEFKDAAARSANWKRLLESDRVSRHDLPEANHTFARRDWRDEVANLTEAWIRTF
jgi:exosortase A-associated hydrolase 1